jgi:CDP-glucose 4,6-dehydratase
VTPNSSFWSGRRVLLTGHTGFKGSWLALWLLELGAHVTGLALPPETEPSLFAQLELDQRLDHRLGDIRDPALLSELVAETRPDVVLHLAAQPLVRRSYAEPTATWATNVMGTIHLLEALRGLDQPCSAVLITTDKVYRNNEWLYGYRENDPLGGHDPYSSSKAAAELAIASWRASFCGSLPHQSPHLRIASARAGNVIGGGDWAADRIVPDAMRALGRGEPIGVRNPAATRPWQHVLEPLCGYLRLAEALWLMPQLAGAYNFGPPTQEAATVRSVIEQAQQAWGGGKVLWGDGSEGPHEAGWLALEVAKAREALGVQPRWGLEQAVERTLQWYRGLAEGASAQALCEADLQAFMRDLA